MGFITGFFAALLGIGVGWALYEWMAFAVLMLVLLPFVEHERGWRITFTLIAAFTLACFATGGGIVTYIRDNPLHTFYWIIEYLAAGAVWASWQWNKFSYRSKVQLAAFIKMRTPQWIKTLELYMGNDKQPLDDDAKAKVREKIDQLKAGKIPADMIQQVRSEWRDDSGYGRPYRSTTMKPSPLNHKKMITMWMAFWPWSLVFYAFGRLAIDVLNWMWRRLVGFFTAITNRHFKDFDQRLFQED